MNKKLLLILLVGFLSHNAFGVDEEFTEKKDGFSVGFFGGYQGGKTSPGSSWYNAGEYGVGIDYIRSLPEDTWINFGVELKMTTIITSTLSDFGVRVGYGVMLFDMWRTGIGARFDVNMISVANMGLGKYHLTPYLTNSVVFPMNSFSGVELFVDIGMPLNMTNIKNVRVQGVEIRSGLNWLFKIG